MAFWLSLSDAMTIARHFNAGISPSRKVMVDHNNHSPPHRADGRGRFGFPDQEPSHLFALEFESEGVESTRYPADRYQRDGLRDLDIPEGRRRLVEMAPVAFYGPGGRHVCCPGSRRLWPLGAAAGVACCPPLAWLRRRQSLFIRSSYETSHPGSRMNEQLQAISELDRVIHKPGRLMIVALLSAVKECDFLYLLHETEMNKGNISSHLARLEEAGYVEIQKTYRGKVPQTLLRLTRVGRKAFDG
ncbi:MAG: transcriptional regulator [Verrucomicrobiota bacterium]|nr:transcriptional regulator [Verrucomicrobiota bacterium]